MTNYVTNKNCDAMVKDLNPKNDSEGFKSSHLQLKIT